MVGDERIFYNDKMLETKSVRTCDANIRIFEDEKNIYMESSFFPKKFSGVLHQNRRRFVPIEREIVLPVNKKCMEVQVNYKNFLDNRFKQTHDSFIKNNYKRKHLKSAKIIDESESALNNLNNNNDDNVNNVLEVKI